MKSYLRIVVFLFTIVAGAQEPAYTSEELAINDLIDGTLLRPKQVEQPKLAIIIAGSGPTDRNGNQNFSKNNSLKKLAESLSKQGIATFRYDKRIVKQIRKQKIDPNTTFDDFVTDASTVIDYFKNDQSYSGIYVIGHSQGSLVGMLAAKDKVDGFISLAGAGQSIDHVITQQITAMDPSLTDGTKKAFEQLKAGQQLSDYPPALASVFRADIQAFMKSWIKYNPREIVASLHMPILIVNGTKDLQVSVEEAQALKDANTSAQLEIIKDMNHIFFIIDGDTLENSKSYNESFRNISEDLVQVIVAFIKS